VVSKGQQLENDAVSRISSALECFVAICADQPHYLSLSVGLLTVCRENQKIVLAHRKMNPEERLNQSRSNLERYFYTAQREEYENLIFIQYFSFCQSTKLDEGFQDGCPQSHTIVLQQKAALYIIKDIFLKGHERFCLRI
jgi:hypothetical protein